MSVYVASRHAGLGGRGRRGGDFLQGSSSSGKEEKNNPEYFLSLEERQLTGRRTVSGRLELEQVDVTPEHQSRQTPTGWALLVWTRFCLLGNAGISHIYYIF